MSVEGSTVNPAPGGVAVLNGRFEIGERLSEGAFFLTHRGRDTESGNPVAIKVLKPEFAADAAFVEQLLTEAQAARRLKHASIAQVLDVWRERGTVVLATEWVRGINLKDRIRRVAPFPLAVCMDITLAVAQALQYAHENGFVHGDIRPENVLITPDGRVKVTDFGLGAAMAGSSRVQLNALPRSAGYLAPEIAEGRPVDTRSDVYALGCILCEMLTGAIPFPAETPLAAAVKHARDPVPSVRKANATVPVAVDGLVEKCLQKDPKSRYLTPQALLNDVHRIREAIRNDLPLKWSPMEAEGTAVPSKTTPRPKTEPAPPKPRRRPEEDTGPSWKLLLGVALLGLVMVGAFFGIMMALTSTPRQVAVPDGLINMTRERAVALLRDLGLKAEIQEEYSERPVGTVIRTDPRGGTEIKEGKSVYLFLSRGSEPVKVPDLAEKDSAQARNALEAIGLKLGEKRSEYSDIIDKGLIIGQKPAAGGNAQKGSAVDIVLSKGPQPASEITDGDPNAPSLPDEPDPDDPAAGGNAASPNPDLPPSSNEVEFPISRSARGPQRVRIVVRNEDGTEETAYEQEHQPGDTVSQTVTTYGSDKKCQIRVFLNGRVIYDRMGPPFE
jgi:hypothetical protein